MSALGESHITRVRGGWWRAVGVHSRLRTLETIVLVLIGVVLAVAAIYDVARQVRIDDRMHADVLSWQAITGAGYRNAYVELDTKHYTTRDVACGWTPLTDPSKRAMTCLIFAGPRNRWHRAAIGGYYVRGLGAPGHRRAYDRPRYRYGCFGRARSAGYVCRAAAPPGAPAQPLVGKPA
jgi:hypothetical protein